MADQSGMTRTYLVSLRIDVDERGDNPINWDWAALLDLPFTGGVEVLYSGELAPLDVFSPEHETTTPFDKMTSGEVESK